MKNQFKNIVGGKFWQMSWHALFLYPVRNSNKFSLKKTGINKRKENLTSSLYTINEAQRLAEEQWRSPDPILRTRIEIV